MEWIERKEIVFYIVLSPFGKGRGIRFSRMRDFRGSASKILHPKEYPLLWKKEDKN